MVKYLIFGNGWLGNKFLHHFKDSAIAEGRINTIGDAVAQIVKYGPEVVINCIGKTGRPNIDWCESHKDETFLANVTVPVIIAEACQDKKILIVHMGSGCIYEGDYRFAESNAPNFKGSFYSRTKIFAEQLLAHYSNVLQLRIRMPIDCSPSPRNLITKLVGYKQVISVPNSITCMPDLMTVAQQLIERNQTGIFNVVNEGAITHKEILEMYRDIVDPEFKMPEFIPVGELDTVAGRSNCTLTTIKLRMIGIKMRPVKTAIKSCLEQYAGRL